MITEITNKNVKRESHVELFVSRDALCWLARYAVALVWAYDGLYCKVYLQDISHLEVFASLPFIPYACTLYPFMALGLFEAALMGWVVSGWKPR